MITLPAQPMLVTHFSMAPRVFGRYSAALFSTVSKHSSCDFTRKRDCYPKPFEWQFHVRIEVVSVKPPSTPLKTAGQRLFVETTAWGSRSFDGRGGLWIVGSERS